MTAKTFGLSLTEAQIEYIHAEAIEHGYTSETDFVRGILREKFGENFPSDPPNRGGNRYKPPMVGSNVVLLIDWNNHRVGTCGVVEKRTVHGGMVAFGNETILIPYRYLKAEE